MQKRVLGILYSQQKGIPNSIIQVQKKSDEIENFAAFFNAKNTKKSFFKAWKQYSGYQKYLRSMEDRCDRERQIKTLKNCLKSWNEITMRSNRMKIKNEVLQKT